MDQSLACPVLLYVLSKLSAGFEPGSNFPVIFPAADWSALNVAFILLEHQAQKQRICVLYKDVLL